MPIYARVNNGQIDTVGRPPDLMFDGSRWWDLRTATDSELAARGWLPVTTTARPTDTQTTTFDYSVTLVSGVPTETWTERPKTQAEIDAATTASATATLLQQLYTGVASIQAARDAASGDIATADGLLTQALSVKSTAQTKRTQAAAFTASATYQQAQINALRDAIVDILDRQILFAQTFGDSFAYRKAVDQNALITDDALLWLARYVSGRITG